MAHIDLSLIIINWNTKDYLSQCLKSFFETNDGITFEVIVVDNASSDMSVEMVKTEFPQVNVIANNINFGFAFGVNQGIDHSNGKFILILNPDIIFKSKTLLALIECFDNDKTIGALMPKLINLDGSMQYGYIRRKPTVTQVLLFHTLLSPISMKSKYLVQNYLESVLKGNEIEEVEQIPGAFTLIRREVIETVGVMDTSFKLFYEDVDWSYRISMAKWKLVMVHNVEAIHIGGRSFVGPKNEWIFARFNLSLIHFVEKHHHWSIAFSIKTILFLNSLIVFIARIVLLAFNYGRSREIQMVSYRRHKMFLQAFIQTVILRRDIPLHATH